MTVRPTPAVERRVTPRLPFPDGLERCRGLHFCTGNVPAARPKNEAPAGRAQSPRAADRTFIAAPFRDVARAHEVDVRRRATPAAGAAAGSPADRRPAERARLERGEDTSRVRHVPRACSCSIVPGTSRVSRLFGCPGFLFARTRRRGFGRLVWCVRARRVCGQGLAGRDVQASGRSAGRAVAARETGGRVPGTQRVRSGQRRS
jgi:hypothetical protein